MIRARAAFSVSKYASDGFVGETGYAQVYSEDEISEDTELGSRVHAAGYKSVLVSERLCTGEVRNSWHSHSLRLGHMCCASTCRRPQSLELAVQAPLEPRFFWRQRLRWLKGSHLYVTGEGSLFFEPQPHMSFWQKSLYWLCPVCHFVQVWAEPVLFTLPFLCLVLDVCPYGMDEILFASHFVYFGVLSAHSVYYSDPWLVGNALRSKTGGRLLWFTAFKACVNTLMVHAGVKAKVRGCRLSWVSGLSPGRFSLDWESSTVIQMDWSGCRGTSSSRQRPAWTAATRWTTQLRSVPLAVARVATTAKRQSACGVTCCSARTSARRVSPRRARPACPGTAHSTCGCSSSSSA